MKKILLACLVFSTIQITTGQTIDKKWNFGLHGGVTQYNGDLGNGFYKTDQATYGFGGLSISRYMGNRFDLNLFVTKGEVGYSKEVGYKVVGNDSANHFHASFNSATINFRFNILGDESFARPYVFVGGGLLTFDKNYSVDESKANWAIPSFGAGLNIRMGQAVNLNIQETFILSDDDSRDKIKEGGNDMYLMHSIGLTFNAGKKKDADLDGVIDRKDKCPETPKGVSVDPKGCPLDKDKDGIADYQDECPDIAGIIELKGCPDKDLDGIRDQDDRCPDAKGSATLRGCPDTDNDGVVDIDDKCAATDPKYKVDSTGCPMDNDKDGIMNEDDKCPDIAGILALKGCMDTDSDGVADNEDRCPLIKGTLTNRGCPELAKEDIKKITQIASRIFFETNKDKLKVASLVQLDDLVEIIQKYPEANLIIEGHTDDVGEDEYNMTLSQKRTEAVKKYLVSKGVSETRLTATGFGETKPIADNKTSLGRAKNRRVELKTSY